MITKKFIYKVHYAFDELNYRVKDKIDFNEFADAAIKTINYSKDLTSAKNGIKLFRFCIDKWKKIEKIFAKKLEIYNSLDYEGSTNVLQVSEKEAKGQYLIYNGIEKKQNIIYISSESLDNTLFVLNRKKKIFRISGDGDYYMKFASTSYNNMKIFDNSKNLICGVYMTDECQIEFNNNTTIFILVPFDGFVGIFNRNYVNSLKSKNDIDLDKMIADIEWDLLDEKSHYGAALLNIYEEPYDLELFILLSASTFLLFNNYMSGIKQQYYYAVNKILDN